MSCQIKWVILLNIRLRHDKYELVRYGLKKYNLIEDGPSLEDRQCEVDWDKGQCYNCMATHICAKKVLKGRHNPWATAEDNSGSSSSVVLFRIHSQVLFMKLLKLPTQKPKL